MGWYEIQKYLSKKAKFIISDDGVRIFENHLVIKVVEEPANSASVALVYSNESVNDFLKTPFKTIFNGALKNLNVDCKDFLGTGAEMTLRLDDVEELDILKKLSFLYQKPYCFGLTDPKKTMLEISNVNIPAKIEEDTNDALLRVKRNCKKITLKNFPCISNETSLIYETIEDGRRGNQYASLNIPNSESDTTWTVRERFLRDTTHFEHTALLGDKIIFTVEQKIDHTIYNRHVASMSRFISLNKPFLSSKSPASIVLHGKIGNSIGNIALYDYFPLGGPLSCRGYTLGELGLARRFIEGAAEIRIPLPKTSAEAYFFSEHANSLKSVKGVGIKTNWRDFISSEGSSYGFGIKIECYRIEYARDCNKEKGGLVIQIGERY